MNAQDAEACSKRSESAILELKVGYEAIVLARDVASGPLALSSRDLLLALAREIPDPDQPGAFIINPNFTWRQVNPALPNERIDVVGPAAGSTTHEALVQLLLDNRAVRDDGVYSEANDKDSVARALIDRPNAIGFLSYSSFLLYAGKLTAGAIDGVPPTYETFASGAYSASRALYVYTKKSHLDGAPDLVRFLSGYASDETIGPNGYLAGRGIVPLNASERAKTRTALLTGK
jgi:phosphate transport system substrate-binding protein